MLMDYIVYMNLLKSFKANTPNKTKKKKQNRQIIFLN